MLTSVTGAPRDRVHILNLEPDGYSDEARRVLATLGQITDGPLSRDCLLQRLRDYDVLIVRLAHDIDRDVLNAGPRLQAIVSGTTGLDHIDLATARSKGITVLSLRGEEAFLESITATPELTWGLLLALVRRIPEAAESVRRGEWNRDAFKGIGLGGRRLGIVGLGRIGRMIAQYGAAFRMRVRAYDPFAASWPADVARADSLQDLLADTDVLSIHVHLQPETVGLIGRRELAWLPKGAIVLNTSRGEIVDEAALAEALQAGHLRGAAVDVLQCERDGARRSASPLLAYAKTHSNVLITPHLGGATAEAMHRTELFMARKLVSWFAAAPLASRS